MLQKLSNPRMFVFIIIWMMFLVVIGTVAQRDIGLFQAQQQYFFSIFFWLKINDIPIFPLPGGLPTMSILFINLASFFLKPNIWKSKKLGILIVHSGALILLMGGGITAIFSDEGNMMIQEGEKVNYIQNAYEKEFTITIDYGNTIDSLKVVNFNESILNKNNPLHYDQIPFKIKIIDYFINSNLVEKNQVSELEKGILARNYNLIKKPYEKEYEKNKAGIKYQIISNQNEISGIYISCIDERNPINLKIDSIYYELSLRPKRTYLPFEIELKDFEKIMHPGTEIAKSFSSEVYLNENDISKRFLIEMNAPLRYNGYTFYQASYFEYEGKEFSIFAVVKNYGRLFPYIASIIMCIGVLIQMITRIPQLLRKNEK